MSHKKETAKPEPDSSGSRMWLYAGLSLALFAAAIYGHVKVSADPDHIAGIPLVLNHLFNLLIAGVMFAIFFSTGRRLLVLFGFDWDSFAEEFVFCTAVGAGVIACLILATALAGLLNRYVVATIFLVALIASAGQFARLAAVGRSLIARDYSRPIEVTYLLGFALLVLVMIFRALTPPHAVDEAISHL